MAYIIGTLVVCAVISAVTLARVGHPLMGGLLGLFLGPIGVLASVLMFAHYRTLERQKESDRRLAAMFRQTQKAMKPPEKPAQAAPAAAAVVREERECPFCAELILKKARVCKHCRRDVEPVL